jgi:predicted MPP superfamily phosphohydrolase
MITRRGFLKGAAGTVAAGGGVLAYAVVIEPNFRLVTREWTISPASWRPDSPPLRIVALSDFHAVRPWMTPGRIARIVRAAVSLKPDLIALLGDYESGLSPRFRTGLVPVSEWARALSGLRAPLGVYGVYGNHDAGDEASLTPELTKAGIRVLQNQAVKIRRGGYDFWIAGLADHQAQPEDATDLNKTLKRITDNASIVMLVHEPDTFVQMPERVVLTLSGHNHGGQARLPFVGAPWIHSQFGQRYLYGLIEEDGRSLVVSGGLGLTGLPLRFLSPPEITVVNVLPPAGVIAQARSG